MFILILHFKTLLDCDLLYAGFLDPSWTLFSQSVKTGCPLLLLIRLLVPDLSLDTFPISACLSSLYPFHFLGSVAHGSRCFVARREEAMATCFQVVPREKQLLPSCSL